MESAYQHMHAAEVQLLDLYDEKELHAEIRPAVVRANAALNREDPHQRTVEDGLTAASGQRHPGPVDGVPRGLPVLQGDQPTHHAGNGRRPNPSAIDVAVAFDEELAGGGVGVDELR